MSIIIFIIILAVLILSHEFGHFIVAKKLGIRVDEFGLGFPPRAWSIRKGETEYSLNWIPFGGFVKIFGENPDDDSISGPDASRSIVNKSRWVQAAVLVAGVSFNIILAWFLLSIGYISGLPSSTEMVPAGIEVKQARLLVTSVLPGSPAEKAGIKVKDQLLYLFDGKTRIDKLEVRDVQEFFAGHGNQEVKVGVNRSSNPFSDIPGEQLEFKVTPIEGVVPGKAGVGISLDKIGIVSLPIHLAFWEGGKLTYNLTKETILSLIKLIKGLFSSRESTLGAVIGPIGLIGLVGDARGLGLAYLLSFTAFISINLAVINLVPFPALDGGRLLFLAIEGIRRKRFNPKVINMVNTIGFLILIGFMLAVTYGDIVRLFIK